MTDKNPLAATVCKHCFMVFADDEKAELLDVLELVNQWVDLGNKYDPGGINLPADLQAKIKNAIGEGHA